MNELQVVNDNAIVVQSGELVEANYKLSISEQRLILALSSQIDTRKTNFEIVRVTAKSLSDACGFNPKGGYRQLQQTAKKLLNRSLIIKNRNNDDWDGTHWVQYCKYRSQKKDDIDGSYIEVEFDKRLCPHLLQLSNKFLKANLSQLVSFSHIYSTRFYMIFRNLVNNLPQCQKKYTFKEIITLLELPKTYEKSIVNLKYKVIRIAVDEINEKSDIEVKYEYYRGGGRAHIGVIFTFWKKTDKKEITPLAPADEAEQPPQITSSAVVSEPTETTEQSAGVALLKSIGINSPSPMTANNTSDKEEPAPAPTVTEIEKVTLADGGEGTNWTDEQQLDYDCLLRYGVWTQTAKKYVITYDHARIERNIQGCIKSNPKGNIRDLGAVMANAIANDTYKGAEEQAKAREREQARKKAEYDAIIKEKEENRQAESDKNKKLEEIRSKKTKKELIEIFEKIASEYKNNNEILNDEMIKNLEENGIPRSDFTLYISSMRNLIKYIK